MGYRPDVIVAFGRMLFGVIVVLILPFLLGEPWTVMLGLTWQAPMAQITSNTDTNLIF